MKRPATRVVVLISGNGSNLQSLIDAIHDNHLHAEIVGVLSDKPDAYGLQRAQHAGIAVQSVDANLSQNRVQYDRALLEAIDAFTPELVLLAGFMRILSPPFVRHYEDRLLNIHPSLLPGYRGLHTHRRVLAAEETEHGCSIHFVTDVLDGGPLIAQVVVPVLSGDDESTLSARVQQAEHKLYPLVAGWFADGRLMLREGRVWLDKAELKTPVRFQSHEEIK